ncbi:MAG: cysteine desulfurase family protein, partial [Candidatus Nanoarchaeia archaeon]|nr:cysteine desulfurase family protein [Candidatus Nanoarchaeia archaeon]
MIYLDNAASTKVDDKVLKAMKPYFSKEYANASSIHSAGEKAKKALETARKIIADSINASAEEIIFTSGGTESNNFAIKATAFANKNKNHIITSKAEHDCVLNSCKWLQTQGFKITYLDVDEFGAVNPESIKKAITKKTGLVTIMHANNEVGTINNIEKIGKICKEKKVYFHSDACQSYTKVDIDVNKMNLDLLTINSHKIHGPKGVGALYIKKGTKINAWQSGGAHEFGLRSGTENIAGIIGFAKAVEMADKKDIEKMSKLRDYLIKKIFEEIPDVKLNGATGKDRLCNNVNISFKGIEGEGILLMLSSKGVMVSTGSACSSTSLKASHVLLAMGLKHELAHASIRFSLSKC